MARLPFGERVLFDSPALSSSPGQDPPTKTGSCTIRKPLPPGPLRRLPVWPNPLRSRVLPPLVAPRP